MQLNMQDRKECIVKLYDSFIEELKELLPSDPEIYAYDENDIWQESQEFELILQKETAYELGERGCESVNYTLITTNQELVPSDQVTVYGPDLQELTGAASYARISLAVIRDKEEWEHDSEKLYKVIGDIDFVKYHVFPKGYMLRCSARTHREQVRVSKESLKAGMTFSHIGNTIIKHMKENPNVLAVNEIFVTAESANYKDLIQSAAKAAAIRRSLSVLNKGMPTECGTCDIREICNDVEGLRELHFGQNKERKKQDTHIKLSV